MRRTLADLTLAERELGYAPRVGAARRGSPASWRWFVARP